MWQKLQKIAQNKFVKSAVTVLACVLALFIIFYTGYEQSEQRRQEREDRELRDRQNEQPELPQPLDRNLPPIPIPQAQVIVTVE